jgi:hypothetical protein
MNVNQCRLLLLLSVLVLSATVVQGQPMASTEQIGPTTLEPDESLDSFIPNFEDPHHPKLLAFRGTIANLGTASQSEFYFDWIDPFHPSQVQHSPTIPIDLLPGETAVFGLPAPDSRAAITYTIPICPPQVSVHLHHGDPGGPVQIRGEFTRICRVLKPSSMLLMGLGLAGVGVVSLCRRS